MSMKSYTTETLPPGFTPEPGMPLKVSLLRWKLGNKAKQEPRFRFYAIYDRIYRWDVLWTAYRKVRENDGCPGYDRKSFEDIESAEGGLDAYLKQIQLKLKDKTYQPGLVKRVYILKENGKERPLGIPGIDDRVVQQATVLILEPIFEQDFQECSHGFRPRRKAHDAIQQIKENFQMGKGQVYDADLSSYFDTISHEKLIGMLEERIADRSMLRLIRMWLKCTIVEEDDDGNVKMTKPTEGTPQGGVISPLLANVFLNYFDRAFCRDADSPLRFANARLVRYADDFVIQAKYVGTRIIRWIEEKIEGDLKLRINKEKTKTVDINLDGEVLNFLGFSFRKDKDLHGRDGRYLNIFPSDKSVKKLREKIKALTTSSYGGTLKDLVRDINLKTGGWKNYFKVGYPRKAFREINYYIQVRTYSFLGNRSQRVSKPFRRGESVYAGLKRYGLRYL